MLRDARFNKYKFYLEIANSDKLNEYTAYCKSINSQCLIRFIEKPTRKNIDTPHKDIHKDYFKIIKLLFSMMRTSIIITATMESDITFRTSRQKIICLGYGGPFKISFISKRFTADTINASYDFYITTSKFSSHILSSEYGLSYDKFLELGYSRNDNLFEVERTEEIRTEIKDIIKHDFKFCFLYTPTFRDYEQTDFVKSHDIFGYDEDYTTLSKMLIKSNAIILAKLHPWQNKLIINKSEYQNMYILQPSSKFSLYDIMLVSDALITDYTSAYNDYLLLNRPVIFNMYDLELYEETRGLSLEPVEFYCAGEIVTSFKELMSGMSDIINGIDKYRTKRVEINPIFNKYLDNNSSKRICNKLLNIIGFKK
jgi:hypothetical protein